MAYFLLYNFDNDKLRLTAQAFYAVSFFDTDYLHRLIQFEISKTPFINKYKDFSKRHGGCQFINQTRILLF